MTEVNRLDVVIVGAGISGLAAARLLGGRGQKVLVLDKGRSVGGRLATRRIGGGTADHGAQFFTVRSPEFKQVVDRWLAANQVYVWANGFSAGSLGGVEHDGHPRFAARGGMNTLAKSLAADAGENVIFQVNVTVKAITLTAEGWTVQDDAGNSYFSRKLLLTPPVPQSVALLGDTINQLSAADREALTLIEYAPNLCGLFVVAGDVLFPEPGALQRHTEPISWIADNQRKGISDGARVITAHGSPGMSRKYWDRSDADVLATIQGALQPFLAEGASITESALKRWRYALPTVLHPERYLLANGVAPLAFAGDAFYEARVEGAYLSGLAAGAALA